jgi:hypothetical protein
MLSVTNFPRGLQTSRPPPNLYEARTPKTNGKAERFIQTALREWAYARLPELRAAIGGIAHLASPLQLASPTC